MRHVSSGQCSGEKIRREMIQKGGMGGYNFRLSSLTEVTFE